MYKMLEDNILILPITPVETKSDGGIVVPGDTSKSRNQM